MEGAVITIAIDRDEYAELVRAFPPRPIHRVREYNATVAVMNKLAVREEEPLSVAEQDYLDALSTFVERYDEEHFPQEGDVTP